MIRSIFPILCAAIASSGTPIDSLSIRFGAGLARPFLHQVFSSQNPDAQFERTIPTLPTIVAGSQQVVRWGNWEAGTEFGLECEALSFNRLDGTEFSLAHLGAVGGWRAWNGGSASIWTEIGGGWSWPVFTHDFADQQASFGGPRGSLDLIFRRDGIQFVFGQSFSFLSFSDRNGKGTSTTDWKIQYWSIRAEWEWLRPTQPVARPSVPHPAEQGTE